MIDSTGEAVGGSGNVGVSDAVCYLFSRAAWRNLTGTHSSQMSTRSLVPFCRLSHGDAFSDSTE
jgi:hypothetical protein